MKLTLIIIIAFIVWFSSLWVAVLSIMSIIGGWNKLYRIYPLSLNEVTHDLVKYSMCSLKIGLINYNACAKISFTGRGFILEMMKIFTVMHKPLFIPYEMISDAKRGKIFFSTYTSFTIENKTIVIFGKAGDELHTRISGLNC